MRHFIIIEIGSIAAARFAGWFDKSLSYLGLRLRSTPATVFFVNLIKWLFRGNKKTSGYSTTVSDTFSEAGVPGLVAFDHRIEDGQHLSHAGDNRDLL